MAHVLHVAAYVLAALIVGCVALSLWAISEYVGSTDQMRGELLMAAGSASVAACAAACLIFITLFMKRRAFRAWEWGSLMAVGVVGVMLFIGVVAAGLVL